MDTYTITIPGKVKAKERPRRGRWGNFYTPQATQNYESHVNTCALQAGLKPFPKDIKKIGIKIFFFGQYGRCDLDNLCKSTIDGFKNFFNDNRITHLTAQKVSSKEYYTEVVIF